MKAKRLLALAAALLMMLCAGAAHAEAWKDLTIEYVGGVVMRSLPKDDPTAELINVAYVQTDSVYCIVDEPYVYSVVLSGGVAPYSVEVYAVWQELDDTSLSYDGYSFPAVAEDYTFSITFTREARYFFQVTVTDAEGQTVVFQTRPFECYPAEAETDATTVAGKVNQIVSDLIRPGMSDYTRARVLHDWLIFNANYDYTYTNYGADGVLLKGTGVCDSYARAYQLLLTAAGIDSTIVTGYAGGGAHGWNMVKLGGSWYHVDCTWDDPGTGGEENWTYFCLTDEQLAADHSWNRENSDPIADSTGMIAPEATDTTYARQDAARDFDFTFATVDELQAGFDASIRAARKGSMVARCTGTDAEAFWEETYGTWVMEVNAIIGEAGEGYATTYGFDGIEFFLMELVWNEPMPYLRIDEDQALGSIGETLALNIAEQAADMTGVAWTSSNEAVATVEGGVIQCLAGGTSEISAVYDGRVLDRVLLTVLDAYAPDFDLTLTPSDEGVTLSWNSIPGVTEYRVMKQIGDADSLVTTVTDASADLTEHQLSSTEMQQVYVIAARCIGGADQLTYESERLTYGRPAIVYTAVLPADTVTVAASAFLNNASLTAVEIPSGAETIGERAFASCAAMTAVRIPASVTSIAASAFDGCSALQYAEVPEGSYAAAWFAEMLPNVILLY